MWRVLEPAEAGTFVLRDHWDSDNSVRLRVVTAAAVDRNNLPYRAGSVLEQHTQPDGWVARGFLLPGRRWKMVETSSTGRTFADLSAAHPDRHDRRDDASVWESGVSPFEVRTLLGAR